MPGRFDCGLNNGIDDGCPGETIARRLVSATVQGDDLFSAVTNGRSAFWPEAEAESDGKWVRVIRDGCEVFACNATYAALNFASERLPDDPGA